MPQQRHKLLILSILIIILLAACGGSDNNGFSASESANLSSYTDDELGLSFSYPDEWIIHNAIGGLTIASSQRVIDSDSLADIGEDGFVLIIPGEIDMLNFQSSQDLSEDEPLPALFVYQQLLENGGQEYLGVEPPHELELDGQNGAITLTRSTIDDATFMTFLAVIMNDGQIALISAGALADSFDGLRPSLEQIITSIQVTVPAGLDE